MRYLPRLWWDRAFIGICWQIGGAFGKRNWWHFFKLMCDWSDAITADQIRYELLELDWADVPREATSRD